MKPIGCTISEHYVDTNCMAGFQNGDDSDLKLVLFLEMSAPERMRYYKADDKSSIQVNNGNILTSIKRRNVQLINRLTTKIYQL